MATFEYDILTSAHRVMIKVFVCIFILFLVAVTVHGQTVKLTLHPAKVSESTETYRLFPSADQQTDADAMPLYEKAIQSMPKGIDYEQIEKWLDQPVEQFPQEKAEGVIQKHSESLQLVQQAAKCKKCNCPEWELVGKIPDLYENPYLTTVLRLWARLEISRGRYEDALTSIQTAFRMAKHLGQTPTLLQTAFGTAVGHLICRELEQFVQAKDSPNLNAGLANLPEPFFDVENATQNESAKHKYGDIASRKRMEMHLKLAFDQMRIYARSLDNKVNALQVVEAIRHYAATHNGQLPQALSDISDIEIPNDLISGKAFMYRQTTTRATLQSALPEGGEECYAVHYEIVLKK